MPSGEMAEQADPTEDSAAAVVVSGETAVPRTSDGLGYILGGVSGGAGGGGSIGAGDSIAETSYGGRGGGTTAYFGADCAGAGGIRRSHATRHGRWQRTVSREGVEAEGVKALTFGSADGGAGNYGGGGGGGAFEGGNGGVGGFGGGGGAGWSG